MERAQMPIHGLSRQTYDGNEIEPLYDIYFDGN